MGTGARRGPPEVWPFARHLRELRDRYGWSQSELARRLGVQPNYINRLESGQRRPGYALLYSLVVQLGCSPYEVLGMPFGKRVSEHDIQEELAREAEVQQHEREREQKRKRKAS